MIEQLASGFHTAEGPTLDLAGGLWFSDVRGGGVYRLDLSSGAVETVIAKRRGVGGISPHAAGGIVVSGRDLSHIRDGETRILFTREDVAAMPGLTVGGFNDIGGDGAGGIVAGAQRIAGEGRFGPGDIIHVTGLHQGRSIVHGVLPNGNAPAPDGRRVYQVDSVGQRVLILDRDENGALAMTGEISTADLPGRPDGMACDVEGGLWIAFHRGGCVARIDPERGLTQRIEMPTAMVTSLCFGPPGSKLLYITTEDEAGPTRLGGFADESAAGHAELAGGIYRIEVGIDGAPVPAVTL